MTPTYLTLITTLIVVVSVNSSPPPSTFLQQQYSSIHPHGMRQEFQQLEPFQPSPQFTFPEDTHSEDVQIKPTEPTKVIIKLASEMKPSTNKNNADQQQGTNEVKNGCSCEKIDSCPVELMDFSFAVSCAYGTVRCCRPLESPLVTPVVSTPTKAPSTKKPVMCKCKPRKECDWFFHGDTKESELIDRKDDCPAGSVRCCETGNMGNPKEPMINQQQQLSGPQFVLGNSNNFRPIQLPYLKMPNTERISENEPLPQSQEIPTDEEVTPLKTQPAIVAPTSAQPVDERPIQPQSQPQSVQEAQKVQQQPVRPIASPLPSVPTVQQPAVAPLGTPMKQPQQFQLQQPVANPVFNTPIRQQVFPMNVPFQSQFGAPVQHQQQQQPFHAGLAPLRQTVQQRPQQFPQQAMMMPPQVAVNEEQPAAFRPPFGLQPPPNNQQFGSAQMQLNPPRPLTNQNFFQPLPGQAPPVQQQQPASSGGFFSNLMSMFSGN